MLQSRQPVKAGRAADQPHHAVPNGARQDVGHRNRQERGDSRRVGAPLREMLHVPVVPRRADDRQADSEHREPAPAESAGDPPRDEEDEPTQRDTNPQDRLEVWIWGDDEVPPPDRLPEDDKTSSDDTAGHSAGQRSRNPAPVRARKEGDDDKHDEVEGVKEDDLLRGHGFT